MILLALIAGWVAGNLFTGWYFRDEINHICRASGNTSGDEWTALLKETEIPFMTDEKFRESMRRSRERTKSRRRPEYLN